MTPPLLETRALSKTFRPAEGWLARAGAAFGARRGARAVHAVQDVSLAVQPGEVLGIVGESGCGKSTLGRMLAGILPPSGGEIAFDGKLVGERRGRDHLNVQMVFQNPYASLNPRHRVERIVTEAALYHGLVARRQAGEFAAELLRQVGLDPSYAWRFPHQFSGGQRQRIAIARALALNPRLMVCDEAVSALDVSVQAQILNLFQDLRASRGLTYLFISHNLAVVEYLADRVAIMYLGRIVELTTAQRVFSASNHPYTQALVADAPRLDATPANHGPIQGELPSPLDPPSGCAFHPRCPYASERCKVERPALRAIALDHWSACHLNDPA